MEPTSADLIVIFVHPDGVAMKSGIWSEDDLKTLRLYAAQGRSACFQTFGGNGEAKELQVKLGRLAAHDTVLHLESFGEPNHPQGDRFISGTFPNSRKRGVNALFGSSAEFPRYQSFILCGSSINNISSRLFPRWYGQLYR